MLSAADSLRLFLLKICSEHVTVFSPVFQIEKKIKRKEAMLAFIIYCKASYIDAHTHTHTHTYIYVLCNEHMTQYT